MNKREFLKLCTISPAALIAPAKAGQCPEVHTFRKTANLRWLRIDGIKHALKQESACVHCGARVWNIVDPDE